MNTGKQVKSFRQQVKMMVVCRNKDCDENFKEAGKQCRQL